MIRIYVNCNLDDYSSSDFPTHFTSVPRKGERVYVRSELQKHFNSIKLPTHLEVKSVHYQETSKGVAEPMIDLWFDETTFKLFYPNGLEHRR